MEKTANLTAIYRLEFYKKQENWKFPNGARKVKLKTKKPHNQTHNLENFDPKLHSLNDDFKEYSESENQDVASIENEENKRTSTDEQIKPAGPVELSTNDVKVEQKRSVTSRLNELVRSSKKAMEKERSVSMSSQIATPVKVWSNTDTISPPVHVSNPNDHQDTPGWSFDHNMPGKSSYGPNMPGKLPNGPDTAEQLTKLEGLWQIHPYSQNQQNDQQTPMRRPGGPFRPEQYNDKSLWPNNPSKQIQSPNYQRNSTLSSNGHDIPKKQWPNNPYTPIKQWTNEQNAPVDFNTTDGQWSIIPNTPECSDGYDISLDLDMPVDQWPNEPETSECHNGRNTPEGQWQENLSDIDQVGASGGEGPYPISTSSEMVDTLDLEGVPPDWETAGLSVTAMVCALSVTEPNVTNEASFMRGAHLALHSSEIDIRVQTNLPNRASSLSLDALSPTPTHRSCPTPSGLSSGIQEDKYGLYRTYNNNIHRSMPSLSGFHTVLPGLKKTVSEPKFSKIQPSALASPGFQKTVNVQSVKSPQDFPAQEIRGKYQECMSNNMPNSHEIKQNQPDFSGDVFLAGSHNNKENYFSNINVPQTNNITTQNPSMHKDADLDICLAKEKHASETNPNVQNDNPDCRNVENVNVAHRFDQNKNKIKIDAQNFNENDEIVNVIQNAQNLNFDFNDQNYIRSDENFQHVKYCVPEFDIENDDIVNVIQNAQNLNFDFNDQNYIRSDENFQYVKYCVPEFDIENDEIVNVIQNAQNLNFDFNDQNYIRSDENFQYVKYCVPEFGMENDNDNNNYMSSYNMTKNSRGIITPRNIPTESSQFYMDGMRPNPNLKHVAVPDKLFSYPPPKLDFKIPDQNSAQSLYRRTNSEYSAQSMYYRTNSEDSAQSMYRKRNSGDGFLTENILLSPPRDFRSPNENLQRPYNPNCFAPNDEINLSPANAKNTNIISDGGVYYKCNNFPNGNNNLGDIKRNYEVENYPNNVNLYRSREQLRDPANLVETMIVGPKVDNPFNIVTPNVRAKSAKHNDFRALHNCDPELLHHAQINQTNNRVTTSYYENTHGAGFNIQNSANNYCNIPQKGFAPLAKYDNVQQQFNIPQNNVTSQNARYCGTIPNNMRKPKYHRNSANSNQIFKDPNY